MEHTAKLLLREVFTVGPDETINAVTRIMRSRHVGCVVVAQKDKIVGIFTERDLLNRVAAEGIDGNTTPVSKVMTPDPICVAPGEPLQRVFELLSQRRFRHVPIAEEGRAVGMVSLSDFAGVLKEVFSEERYAQYFVAYWQQRES
ncbi:MAG: oxidoreductase [Elusimicrobia bacterium]|nr:MAG: oxidoreductase [Elusimicrobiota bacterium]